MIPKPPRSMCITVRVNADMRTELLTESCEGSLSKVLNKKVTHALKMLIDEAHNKEEGGER